MRLLPPLTKKTKRQQKKQFIGDATLVMNMSLLMGIIEHI